MTSPAHAPPPFDPPRPGAALEVVTPYVSACVDPATDPLADAARWLDAALDGRPVPPLLLVIGLGLGHLLDVLDGRAPATRVLALEPSPEVARAFHARRDWTAWRSSGRLLHLVGPDYSGADEAWRMFPDQLDDRMILSHPVLARSGGEAAVHAARTLKHIVFGVTADRGARCAFAPRYLTNTLKNLPAIVAEADVAPLSGAFRGVPAVITAAGPSLDHNVEDLRRLGERALLIAVDTTVRPLSAAGIEPHLIVSADSSETNARHLLGAPLGERSVLVAESSVDPRVLERFPQRTVLFRVGDHEPWPWLRRHQVDCGELRAWGSVLTAAFDLAVRAGCDPVAFAGADLAFTGEQPYCRGTVYEDGWARARELGYEQWFTWRSEIDARGAVSATDIHGQPIRTSASLLAFREWIAGQTARIADRRFVNVSGAGILAGGRIEQGRLSDVLGASRRGRIRDGLRRQRRRPAATARDVLARLRGDLDAVAANGLSQAWSRFSRLPADAVEQQVAAIAATLRER